jgi:hypothetical protein
MKKLILASSLVLLVVMPTIVSAQGNWLNWMSNTIENTPVKPEADLVAIIFRAIQYILAFLGVVAVVIIIYAGFLWMTAAGNDEKVGKAKKTMISGIIGLVIILLAYAIAGFVIQRLDEFSNVI